MSSYLDEIPKDIRDMVNKNNESKLVLERKAVDKKIGYFLRFVADKFGTSIEFSTLSLTKSKLLEFIENVESGIISRLTIQYRENGSLLTFEFNGQKMQVISSIVVLTLETEFSNKLLEVLKDISQTLR